MPAQEELYSEGTRTRWYGWASNPGGGVRRFLVGSTPAAFRHERLPLVSYNIQQRLEVALKPLVFRDLIHSADVQGGLVASRDSRTIGGGYLGGKLREIRP
jgi:hypothetical protein